MSIVTRGVSGAGRQLRPGAINIKSVEISNYRRGDLNDAQARRQGSMKDITRIIAKLSIIEDIRSPTLKLKLGIKDATGFAETFPIVGQEIIKITTRESSAFNEEVVEKVMTFYVTNYPNFGKSHTNENISAYTIEGISKHAYISGFKKISRSYNNPSSAEILNIFMNDLDFPLEKINLFFEEDISKSKGVINIQSPLKAADFFRKAAYDSTGSPFFLFETLDGVINFISLKRMISESSMGEYKEVRGFNSIPETEQEFNEQKHRIINITSNLNLSGYKKGRAGAFSSENNYLDWSNKSYNTFNYNYMTDLDEETTLEDNKIISSDFKISDQGANKALNELPSAAIHYIAKNDESFTGLNNYGSTVSKQYHKLKAHSALLSTHNHVLTLIGDTKLNAGKVIDILIPSSIEPANRTSVGMTDAPEADPNLSGKYLITTVIHKIENGKYFSTVQVVRDSFSISLGSSTTRGTLV
tara:strand:+ start:292 stop:1707 length:1416 start_codon:yes stop_codon:yes gene_type:complete